MGKGRSKFIIAKYQSLQHGASFVCYNNGNRVKDSSHALYHMGTKLLCEDISNGHETVLIPCTNDVDSDPAPIVNYIIENRYLGRAKFILGLQLLDKRRAAKTCIGCDVHNADNPNLEVSVHAALTNFHRESDT